MVCPKCGGKKHIFVKGKGWVKCDCFYESRARRFMVAGHFPKTLVELNLSSFVLVTKQDKDFAKLLKITAEKKKLGDIVFIYSPTFKKETMAALYTKVMILNGLPITKVSMVNLSDLGEEFFKKDNPLTCEIKDSEILVLEIGDEVTTSVHVSILVSLLKSRKLNNLTTVLVSSVSEDMLKTRYKDSVGEIIKAEAVKFRV